MPEGRQSCIETGYELVRVAREVVDHLIAEPNEPAVIVSLERQDDGTAEMLFKRTDVIADNARLRKALQAALDMNLLMQSDEEDNDSPGNMQHAILIHALETTPPGQERPT